MSATTMHGHQEVHVEKPNINMNNFIIPIVVVVTAIFIVVFGIIIYEAFRSRTNFENMVSKKGSERNILNGMGLKPIVSHPYNNK